MNNTLWQSGHPQSPRPPSIHHAPPTGNRSLATLWSNAMRAEGQSEATIKRRTGTLRRFSAQLGRDARTATTDDITSFISRYRSAATRSAYDGDLRAFWAWLLLTGRAETSPTAQLRPIRSPKRIPKPITTEQLHAGLVAATGDLRAQILLGAYEGLRRSEIAEFRGEDIRRSLGLVYVCGKGADPWLIPLHDLVAEEAARRPGRGWWFPSDRNPTGHVCSMAVYKGIKRHFGRLDIQCTPHQLRHWFGTELLRSGADIRQVQESLRHRSLTSTEGYTAVAKDHLVAAVSRLPRAS